MGKACPKCGGLTRLCVLKEDAKDFAWPPDGSGVSIPCPNGHPLLFRPTDDLLRWKEASV